MRRAVFAAGAVLSLAVPQTIVAKSKDPKFVVTSAVADKPTVPFDPARAYVLLRSEMPTPLYLMKMPNEAEQAAYAKLRAEALSEAHEKYVKKLASYEAAVKQAAATPKGSPRPSVPDKPVEPTESNFEFTPFGLLAAVPIGPLNRFAKGEGGASTYLQATTPGRYRIYGPVLAGNQGAMAGACFCMGSVSFEAKAGEVVDLGLIAKADPADAPKGMTPPGLGYLRPVPAGMPLDPRLAKAVIRPAQFRPVGKIPNYFGLAITRMPAMPGVMRYERDRIVDLTAAR